MTQKNQHGGYRPNAGRPPATIPRHQVRLWLSDEEEVKVQEFVTKLKTTANDSGTSTTKTLSKKI